MESEDPFHEGRFKCSLFDLDDTLYPLSSGLSDCCRKNIEDFMFQKLGIEERKVPDMCVFLYKKYGTTLAGLRAIGHKIDYDEYHRYVHGRLPYDNLKPDPALRNLLLSLPFRKLIFTNADKVHAEKILSKLGLEDCFEGMICFEDLNSVIINDTNGDLNSGDLITIDHTVATLGTDPNCEVLPATPVICKPSSRAMDQAMKIANVNPHTTIFFDDSVRNIQSGKQAGLYTVLVGTSITVKGADFAVENIHNLREAFPELWRI